MRKLSFALMMICLLVIPVVLAGCSDGNPVVGIEMNTLPDKVNYYVGEPLDLSGATFSVIRENGEVEVMDMSKVSVSSFDSSTLGKKTVIVTYRTDGLEFTTGMTFTVISREPVSMSVETPPAKTQFVAGSPIDLTGLTVRIVYAAPEGQEGASIVRGLDLLTVDDKIAREGQTSVKVHFNELSLDVPIEIVERRPVDARVRLEEGYVIWQYSVFDLVGIVVEIQYNDGSYELAPFADYEEYGDILVEAGTKTIHVVCSDGFEFQKSVEGQLPVQADSVIGLEILSHPTFWPEDKAFALDGLTLRITTAHNTLDYDASLGAIPLATSLEVGEVPAAGETDVSVTLGGFEVHYTMTVGPNVVVALDPTRKEALLSYYVGETPVFSNLALYAVYADGTKVLIWDGRQQYVAEGVTTKGAVAVDDTQSWVCYEGIYYYVPIHVIAE